MLDESLLFIQITSVLLSISNARLGDSTTSRKQNECDQFGKIIADIDNKYEGFE
jgi:hypothetical protein